MLTKKSKPLKVLDNLNQQLVQFSVLILKI